MIRHVSITDDFVPIDAVVDDPLDFVEEEHLRQGRRLTRARWVQLHHRRRQLLRLIGDDAEAVDVVNAMLGGVEVADFRLENERAELRRQFSRNGDFTWGGSGVSSIWTTAI